jgi:hypothetical protein
MSMQWICALPQMSNVGFVHGNPCQFTLFKVPYDLDLQYILILIPMGCLQIGHAASLSPHVTHVAWPQPKT